jgi:hypothetical protein
MNWVVSFQNLDEKDWKQSFLWQKVSFAPNWEKSDFIWISQNFASASDPWEWHSEWSIRLNDLNTLTLTYYYWNFKLTPSVCSCRSQSALRALRGGRTSEVSQLSQITINFRGGTYSLLSSYERFEKCFDQTRIFSVDRYHNTSICPYVKTTAKSRSWSHNTSLRDGKNSQLNLYCITLEK